MQQQLSAGVVSYVNVWEWHSQTYFTCGHGVPKLCNITVG